MSRNTRSPSATRAGTRRAKATSIAFETEWSCWTWPWVNDRRNVPIVDGARTPPSTRALPPERSTSRSSMLSAPTSIPATIVRNFAATFADATFTPCANRAENPTDSANSSTGTKPAADTRFGSSKTGNNPWDAFTYRVPHCVVRTLA